MPRRLPVCKPAWQEGAVPQMSRALTGYAASARYSALCPVLHRSSGHWTFQARARRCCEGTLRPPAVAQNVVTDRVLLCAGDDHQWAVSAALQDRRLLGGGTCTAGHPEVWPGEHRIEQLFPLCCLLLVHRCARRNWLRVECSHLHDCSSLALSLEQGEYVIQW